MPAASVTTAYYVHKEIQVCANFSVGIIKELINWNVILYHKLKKVYFFLNTSPSKGAAIRPQLSYHNGISSMDCTFSCMSKMSFHLCFYRFSLHFCFFFFFYFLIFFFFLLKQQVLLSKSVFIQEEAGVKRLYYWVKVPFQVYNITEQWQEEADDSIMNKEEMAISRSPAL